LEVGGVEGDPIKSCRKLEHLNTPIRTILLYRQLPLYRDFLHGFEVTGFDCEGGGGHAVHVEDVEGFRGEEIVLIIVTGTNRPRLISPHPLTLTLIIEFQNILAITPLARTNSHHVTLNHYKIELAIVQLHVNHSIAADFAPADAVFVGGEAAGHGEGGGLFFEDAVGGEAGVGGPVGAGGAAWGDEYLNLHVD